MYIIILGGFCIVYSIVGDTQCLLRISSLRISFLPGTSRTQIMYRLQYLLQELSSFPCVLAYIIVYLSYCVDRNKANGRQNCAVVYQQRPVFSLCHVWHVATLLYAYLAALVILCLLLIYQVSVGFSFDTA